MRRLTFAIACMAILASVGSAAAQGYPTRPITLIAPFPPGGPLDTIARIISEPMRASLGQPMVIENVAGAGGNIGIGRLARARPDGYTVGIGQWSTHVVNAVTYSLPYDVVDDFEPIALLTDTPQLIIARKDFPAKDVQELVAWLKANPDKATRRDRRRGRRRAGLRRSISRRRSEPASPSCPIAAAPRRCRTSCPAASTSCSTRPPTRSGRCAPAPSRPMR